MSDSRDGEPSVRRLSRRRLLERGTTVGLGVAAMAVTGCGSDPSPNSDRKNDPNAADAPITDLIRPAGEEVAPGSIILGRPTTSAITLSYLTAEPREVLVEYKPDGSGTLRQTPPAIADGGEPLTVTVSGLEPGRRYTYRMLHRKPGENAFRAGPERTFNTAKPAGSPFTFTMQADSHRDENSNLDVYRQTLANVRTDLPDFHIDLGDTFMCDKFAKTDAVVVARYREEREWFHLISDTVPLFLVNGNHEGESGWALNGTENNLAVWAARARQRFYPNPIPDDFYAGNSVAEPFVGQRVGYYAWHWGSALFVALDPFWFTRIKPSAKSDGWAWTLGEQQFRWLEQTLASSEAPFKFVFLHHLVGGIDAASRGGIEAAGLWEWGGRGADGKDVFATQRPGWSAPVHRLLVKNGVSAVFHGHDHVYVKQDLDGVVYQEVPQPSHFGENGTELAAEGSYRSGVVLSSSGHLRVSVEAKQATVEYVKSNPGKPGTVVHSYVIPAQQ